MMKKTREEFHCTRKEAIDYMRDLFPHAYVEVEVGDSDRDDKVLKDVPIYRYHEITYLCWRKSKRHDMTIAEWAPWGEGVGELSIHWEDI